MKDLISSTILLILIMDPLGNLPIFMSILKNVPPNRRTAILLREMTLALMIMFIFFFAGEKILIFLNLKTETVSIAGGIILFLIAIKMIFPRKKKKTIENYPKKKSNKEEPFLIPLAIPLIAGPSLLATLILLSHQYKKNVFQIPLSLILAWSITAIILYLSGLFLKIFGKKCINALERLMGLILIMLSTQMFLNGLQSWLLNI